MYWYSMLKMLCKAGILFLTLLVRSYAFPLEDAQDMSIFFDHSETSSRIIGGTEAGLVPHMVALTNGAINSLHCGGSLIGKRHVLTAAHCIDAAFSHGSLSSSLRGTVGSNSWHSGGIQYKFFRNFTHPNYVESILKNDIGILVTVSNSVALGHTVRIVPLSYDFVGGNVPVRVHGWGMIAAEGVASSTLLELRSNTVEGNRCVEEVRRRALELDIKAPAVQPHIEICTFADASKGACHGDSGSALLLQSNGQQIGVVSWALPCAKGAPDMYARVSAYQSWIEQIIG